MPVKKTTPTIAPITILLLSIAPARTVHARKSATMQTGHGRESQRNVFLEMSHPQDVHFLFV